jgi:hypothetical protein
LLRQQLIDVAPFQEGYTLMNVKKELTEVQNYNVGVGSAVTSYARLHLYRILDTLQRRGFRLYYCDTDSVITDCNLQNHRDLMNQFAPDGVNEIGMFDARLMGTQLGSLKSEAQEIHKDFEVCEQVVGFDEAIFLLPKMYVLRKKHKGEWIVKGASKGFSRTPPYLVRKQEGAAATMWDGKTGTKHLGTWDAEQRAFLDPNTRQKVVVNGFYVNEHFQELRATDLEVLVMDGHPVYRGPPSWEEYEAILEGGTVRRTMRSLTQSFRKAFAEDGQTLLKQTEMTRRATLVDLKGRNRYSKGVVESDGRIRPLVLPEESHRVLENDSLTEAGSQAQHNLQLLVEGRDDESVFLQKLRMWQQRFFPNDLQDEEMAQLLADLQDEGGVFDEIPQSSPSSEPNGGELSRSSMSSGTLFGEFVPDSPASDEWEEDWL